MPVHTCTARACRTEPPANPPTADPHFPLAAQITQKVTEVYLGQRGMLFWANKAAMASSIGLGVAWVLFRLVLPNLGIYQLPGDH